MLRGGDAAVGQVQSGFGALHWCHTFTQALLPVEVLYVLMVVQYTSTALTAYTHVILVSAAVLGHTYHPCADGLTGS